MKQRTIKVRAWDKKNKKWVDNAIGQYSAGETLLDCPTEPFIETINLIFSDDNLIWVQYTGLKDKNGEEIYEGDIVKYMKLTLIVSFTNGHFLIHSGRTDMDKLTHNHEDLWKALGRDTSKNMPTFSKQKNRVEVLGNIYENPELLKENE